MFHPMPFTPAEASKATKVGGIKCSCSSWRCHCRSRISHGEPVLSGGPCVKARTSGCVIQLTSVQWGHFHFHFPTHGSGHSSQ